MSLVSRPKVSVREIRVIRYDDKKILQQYIIGKNWGSSTPTVLGMIKHWTVRRNDKNPEVQAKFKALTHPLIKEEIIKYGSS